MSSIIIAGDTSGSVTLQAPTVAGSTVVTLPSTSMNIGNGGGSVATNTAFGTSALASNTTGANNVAVGVVALQANTTGSQNVAMGRYALVTNTTGNFNVGIGHAALSVNSTASNNTAVGSYALEANSTGTGNSAFGDSALVVNTTGNYNTAIGRQSMQSNTTGAQNVAVGQSALLSNTTASYSTAVGYQAGYVSTGQRNAFFGHQAGLANTTGESNTYIGRSAGEVMTTGSNNTIIGRYSGNQGAIDIRTLSNYIVLSDGDGNPRMWINTVGNGIFAAEGSGTQRLFNIRKDGTSDYAMGIANESVTGGLIDFKGNGSGTRGSITHNGTSVAYNTTSDYRLKENAQPMTGALATVAALKPVTYNWKLDGSSGQGFIAHELQAVVPNAVFGEKDAVDADGNPIYQGIDTSFLVATLTAAIQELNAKITALEAKVGA